MRRRGRSLSSRRLAPGWCRSQSAAVLSHWVLDLLVHRPDLPLYDNSLNVGLGLWNYPVAAFVLEIMFLFGGIYLYMRATKPVARGGRYAMVIFGLAMLAVQGIVFFGPPPASDRTAAVSALLCYSVFVGVDYWLETKRSPVSVVQELSPEASRR